MVAVNKRFAEPFEVSKRQALFVSASSGGQVLHSALRRQVCGWLAEPGSSPFCGGVEFHQKVSNIKKETAELGENYHQLFLNRELL